MAEWLKRQGRRAALPFTLERHLRDLLGQLGTTLVLDVGAHHGNYAWLLRNWARYRGRIASFEPVPASFAILEERFAKDPSWRGFQVGVGDRDEARTMTLYQQALWNSFHELTPFANDTYTLPPQEKIDVQVRRLDAILPELVGDGPERIFLKTDTQGHDFAVLEGLGEWVERVEGLQIELAVQQVYEGVPPFHESLERLADSGWALTGLFPVARDAQLRVVELDGVFRKHR